MKMSDRVYGQMYSLAVMFFSPNTTPSACISFVSSNFDIQSIFRLQLLGRGYVDNTAFGLKAKQNDEV